MFHYGKLNSSSTTLWTFWTHLQHRHQSIFFPKSPPFKFPTNTKPLFQSIPSLPKAAIPRLFDLKIPFSPDLTLKPLQHRQERREKTSQNLHLLRIWISFDDPIHISKKGHPATWSSITSRSQELLWMAEIRRSPVEVGSLYILTGFHTFRVVQDFSYQQYEPKPWQFA